MRIIGELLNDGLYHINELIDIRPLSRLDTQALPHHLTDGLANLDGGCLRLLLLLLRSHAVVALNAGGTLIRETPVTTKDTQREGSASLVGPHLEGGLANEAGIKGAAERPDVDLCVDDGARLDVKELRSAVGHGRVLGSRVLDLEGEGL